MSITFTMQTVRVCDEIGKDKIYIRNLKKFNVEIAESTELVRLEILARYHSSTVSWQLIARLRIAETAISINFKPLVISKFDLLSQMHLKERCLKI